MKSASQCLQAGHVNLRGFSEHHSPIFIFQLGCLRQINGWFKSNCSFQIHWLPSILSTQGTGKCGRTRYCPFYPSLSGWIACHTATTNRENTQQCHATAVPFTDSRVVPPSDQTKQDMPCHAPPSFTCTPAPARTS